MASNEIELTFIRCPSCKSLMPSTAHKCGMCGLNMDEEDAAPTEKKLRLRQRTNSDLESTIDSEKHETEKRREVTVQNISAHDPEAGSMSDDEDSFATESPTYSQEPIDFDGSTEEDYEDLNDDEFGEQEGSSIETNEEPVRKRKRRRRKKKKSPSVESLGEEMKIEPENIKEVVSSNWGSSITNKEPEEDIKEEIRENPPIESKNLYREFNVSKNRGREEAIGPTVLEEIKVPSEEIFKKTVESEKVEVVSKEKDIVYNKNEKIGTNMNAGNKLLGWFVNYSTDANGKCFEIRNGKKFIGRQELRPHDLLIPDSAISTPHCLLSAEGGKIGLQDLMSEQGTFVKHVGDNEFKKIDSSVILKHGDILRLGTFELIVCLIP